MFSFLILFIAFSAIGCTEEIPEDETYATEDEESLSGPFFFLNSVMDVRIFDEDNDTEEVRRAISKEVQRIESLMTMRDMNSDVSKINENAGKEPVIIDKDTFHVIERSLYYSEITDGAFDITVGHLVDLWGIGTEDQRLPSEEEINLSLSLIDYSEIELDKKNLSVFLKREGMMIDLGGIAKGYAADRVTSVLAEHNVESAIINLGGDVYVHGDRDNRDFRVGIQDPFSDRGEHMGIYNARDKSIVTSGNYERFFEEDGVTYHHILSTKDGYPVQNNLVSVTIISNLSIDGDALSTAIYAMGIEDGLNLVNNLDDVETIIVTEDKEVYVSNGVMDFFTISDDSFNLKN
ncbi:thiamine biosynthesis lipoprotein [Acetoanaerobium pronyense]|uniref:FAD:protein FMN transferase n=1 Tax=Acetoanaerobium pronyense TaxID=1482736 RepID=A0ABS4KHU7_9FIRM|nr:thiamine biosynthesis lipoprotein [Acetoanaerobium pronyense]